MIFVYPGLKQYAKRIRTRDFDNVGLTFYQLLRMYETDLNYEFSSS